MNSKTNIYGLKRYIPADKRERIRKEAGFGCVICGSVFVDYEHIDPEFHEAKEHDPDKMTLLCISCHGRVTRKLISKEYVWRAKSNPKALQDGYVYDPLFVDTSEMDIKIGNSSCKNTDIILTIHGKPLIWFEPPLTKGEPSKLCAIFYDTGGRYISFVNRNQFIAFSSNQDVIGKSTELSIKSNNITCLKANREGGKVLHISRMQGQYKDTHIEISTQGELILTQGSSKITLNRFYIEHGRSAIEIGSPPKSKNYRALYLAIKLANSPTARPITNLKNQQIGYALENEIFNLKFELVGYLINDYVFSITKEYIGKLVGAFIAYIDNCYENGEPIYTSRENIEFRNRNPHIGFDVSHRLFEHLSPVERATTRANIPS